MVGIEVTVVVVVCGRRMGICRLDVDGIDGLIISSSVFVGTVIAVTGIVRLRRRETDGKRGTFDVSVGSSVELLK